MKSVERLVLVGDDRLDLGEPAQVDALAQVVHVVEVLAPAVVDDLQQQVALERAHQLVAELLLALVVQLAIACVESRSASPSRSLLSIAASRASKSSGSASPGRMSSRAMSSPSRSQSSTKSPGVYSSTSRSMTPLISSRACSPHVLALEDLVAVLVDDPALLVHHVVVLEDALADEEVLLLDLPLGLLDLLGEHPGLDRLLVALVVDRAEAVEDLVDPVAREEAHEVVLGGEEEARLAGVALAAGAAAQLVVDAARLVALGAADEEAAGLHDDVAGLGDLLLIFGRIWSYARRSPGRRLEAELGELAAREVLGVCRRA